MDDPETSTDADGDDDDDDDDDDVYHGRSFIVHGIDGI